MSYKLLLLLLVTMATSWQSVEAADKQQLAGQVFDAVVLPQAEPIVDRLLLALTREKNPPQEVLTLYKETLLEVFNHPEYRQAYVAAYQKLFSEQDLVSIVELTKHPGFLAFARASGDLTQMTYPTFLKLNAEMEKKLQQRLEKKGLSEWK